MIEQYPDTITVAVESEPTQDPTTGIFTEGSSVTYPLRCRAEKNTIGGFLTGKDGSRIDYGYIAYLPKTDTIIPVGSEYVLTVGLLTVSGTIKDASNGQLNSRLWL